MKKALLTTLALVAVTSSVFAQGTVVFNNGLGGISNTRVYNPDPLQPGVQKVGNTATQFPVGTQTYTGFTTVTGNGFTAELWAIPGSTIPAGTLTPYGAIDNSLLLATPSTTFRTGSAGGVVAQVTATLTGVPKDAAAAVLQMRVYPTSFGSWAGAVTAFGQGNLGAAIGASPMFVTSLIGGDVNTPPNIPGLQSFSLVTPVPEPTSFALAGMGLASLLIFRRRK